MGESVPASPAVKPMVTNGSNNNNKGISIVQWNTSSLTSMGDGDKLKASINSSTTVVDIIYVSTRLGF